MSTWGPMVAARGSGALLMGSRSKPQPRRPRRVGLFPVSHFGKVCSSAQRTLQDGLGALLPGLLRPHAAHAPGEGEGAGRQWERGARLAFAFLASVCLHLGGGGGAAQAVNIPTVAEDKLLELVRLLENKLDTAAQYAAEAVGGALPGAPAPAGPQDATAPASSERWRALVEDVWEVVDANFMDARGAGFSHERWAALRDEALAQPLNSRAAAYGAIRDMVRQGLRDPYSRFISPEEFSAMLKYDVSGVGLNLGTAEEFVNKTGIPLPGYTPPSMAGAPINSQPGVADSLASEGSSSYDGSSSQGAPPAALPLASSSSSSSSFGGGTSPATATVAVAPSSSSSSSGSAGDSSSGGQGVYVLGLIKGSAADEAGLEQGDQLLALGGRNLEGQSPFEVASQLAGGQEDEPADALGLAKQAVQLRVKKYGSGEVLDVSLERPVRVIPSPVTARLERQGGGGLAGGLTGLPLPALFGNASGAGGADPGPAAAPAASGAAGSSISSGEAVGYIRLSSFNARAQRDLAAAVRQLEGQGATRLVLDLRDNRGGLVSEGIEIARLFLQDDALVVRTAGKARASAAPITASGPALTSAPLVVLVNEHTASASEILAGALQDNCRAVLAGKQTYGKGLIQSVYELGDGSGLVLTVGKYMTPRGTDIDREGIRPQFRSAPTPSVAEGALAACRLAPAAQPLPQPRP